MISRVETASTVAAVPPRGAVAGRVEQTQAPRSVTAKVLDVVATWLITGAVLASLVFGVPALVGLTLGAGS